MLFVIEAVIMRNLEPPRMQLVSSVCDLVVMADALQQGHLFLHTLSIRRSFLLQFSTVKSYPL